MPPFRNRRRSGDSVNSQGYGNSKRMSNVSSEGGDKLNRSIIEQVEEAVVESITVIKFELSISKSYEMLLRNK